MNGHQRHVKSIGHFLLPPSSLDPMRHPQGFLSDAVLTSQVLHDDHLNAVIHEGTEQPGKRLTYSSPPPFSKCFVYTMSNA